MGSRHTERHRELTVCLLGTSAPYLQPEGHTFSWWRKALLLAEWRHGLPPRGGSDAGCRLGRDLSGKQAEIDDRGLSSIPLITPVAYASSPHTVCHLLLVVDRVL